MTAKMNSSSKKEKEKKKKNIETHQNALHSSLFTLAHTLQLYCNSASMPTLKARMLQGVPNVVDSRAHRALDLLRALVRDDFE